MKTTGITILVIGVIGLIICGVIAMRSTPGGLTGEVPEIRQDLTIPVISGLSAVAIGGLMVAFGGRGYVISRKIAAKM